MEIYNNKTIREADQTLIIQRGFPDHSLMEIAGLQIAQDIRKRFSVDSNMFIFIGPGNNGGDGLVIARWLFHWGFQPTVVLCSEINSKSSQLNLSLLNESIKIVELSQLTLPEQCVFIDSLLGNGQTCAPRGTILDAIRVIHEHSSENTTLISIDHPTGRDPDNGYAFLDEALSPSLCYSIGGRTKGLFHRSLDMEIVDIDIALPLNKVDCVAQLLDDSVYAFLPRTHRNNAKWDKGHVAIAAKGGAAILAATAALRTGVGLVSVISPKESWDNLRELPPEIMIIEPSQLNPRRHDVLVVGPNWGLDTNSRSFVLEWWGNYPNPMVVDADAISILSSEIHSVSHPRILTPHSAEASRLLGWTRLDIENKCFEAAEVLSKFGLTVLKGPNTIIQNTDDCWICPIRDSRLAIAGSGDVLSGLIGGFCAQLKMIEHSVLLAVYIHAISGTNLNFGDGASDLISSAQRLIREYRDSNRV